MSVTNIILFCCMMLSYTFLYLALSITLSFFRKKMFITVVTTPAISLLILYYSGFEQTTAAVFSYFSIILMFILFTDARFTERLTLTGLCFTFAICSNELLESMIRLFFYGHNKLVTITANLMICIVILLYNKLLKNKIKSTVFSKVIPTKRINVLMIFIVIVLILLTGALSSLKNLDSSRSFQIVVSILSMLGYAGIILLMTTFIRMKQHNTILEQTLQAQQDLAIADKTMYQLLLNREEDTKKYRHDMINHLAVIENKLENNDIKSAQKYISSLSEIIQNKKPFLKSTGNEIIDALNTFYLSKADPSIKIMVRGQVTQNMDLSSIQLSSLYGNLLSNAIEEQNRLSDKIEKQIKILYESGKKFIQITVENSSRESSNPDKTSKADKHSHGIGLNNIRKIISDVNGELYLNPGNPFRVRVVIPIKDQGDIKC